MSDDTHRPNRGEHESPYPPALAAPHDRLSRWSGLIDLITLKMLGAAGMAFEFFAHPIGGGEARAEVMAVCLVLLGGRETVLFAVRLRTQR